MPPARLWPNKADQHRMDAVALFLDVQHFTQRVEAEIIEGDLEEAIRLNAKAYAAAAAGQAVLNAARRMS